MFSILRTTIRIATNRITSTSNILGASFHLLSKPTVFNNINNLPSTFLMPTVFNLTPSCGFKVVGRVRRRCKECYFVRREERLFVICKAHPRHKQMSMVKKARNTWILTHATQSKVRPW